MLAANIETEIKQIIEKKGKEGWLRVQECANEYAKDPVTKQFNGSRKTKFYRVRKQIEKGKVEGHYQKLRNSGKGGKRQKKGIR